MHHDHDHDHEHHHHHHSELDDLNHQHGIDIVLQGEINGSVEEVWDVLTNNEKAKLWFPELTFTAPRAGGNLVFATEDGEFNEKLDIYDFEAPELLSFAWFGNIVTFELKQENEETTAITFSEWIHHPDDHSAKDATGWLICLQQIAAIVEGKEIPDSEELFEQYFSEVEQLLQDQIEREL